MATINVSKSLNTATDFSLQGSLSGSSVQGGLGGVDFITFISVSLEVAVLLGSLFYLLGILRPEMFIASKLKSELFPELSEKLHFRMFSSGIFHLVHSWLSFIGFRTQKSVIRAPRVLSPLRMYRGVSSRVRMPLEVFHRANRDICVGAVISDASSRVS